MNRSSFQPQANPLAKKP